MDEQAKQAAAFGPVVDGTDGGLVHADRDELDQALTLADHAERAVLGVDQPDRGFNDPLERAFQVQAGADRDERLQQVAHPVPGAPHQLDSGLELGQQVVQLKLRQDVKVIVRNRSHQAPLPNRRTVTAWLSVAGFPVSRPLGIIKFAASGVG